MKLSDRLRLAWGAFWSLPVTPVMASSAGGRFYVSVDKTPENGRTLILRGPAGGTITALGLRATDAFMLADLLTPELRERHAAMCRARDALWSFQYGFTELDPRTVRAIGNEADCGDHCPHRGGGYCPKLERGACGAWTSECADNLATAIEERLRAGREIEAVAQGSAFVAPVTWY